ncbi:MAG: type II toxin-antitoxin system HicB family antitoxin [Chloroflexia bacterium]|nr:type II toxin-antitoxin system HicB family antitoxin [Chloroflexia bacterium]
MEHRYRIEVFWYEPDQCWIADVPDLRFCSAHGESPEEALAEVQIAKKLWLQDAQETGESLPRPSPSPVMIALTEAGELRRTRSPAGIA